MNTMHSTRIVWLALAAFGAAAAYVAMGFRLGTVSSIGGAVYPFGIASLLTIVSLYRALRHTEDMPEQIAWRPFLSIVAAIIVFALAIETLGLAPAVIFSTAIAYAAQSERDYFTFLIYAVCLSAGVWAVFVLGLGLPLSAVRMP